MAEHTVHLPLDETRYRRLEREAERRDVPIDAVIRDAIDGLPMDADRRRAAIGVILAAEVMQVPADPAELRRELDSARDPGA